MNTQTIKEISQSNRLLNSNKLTIIKYIQMQDQLYTKFLFSKGIINNDEKSMVLFKSKESKRYIYTSIDNILYSLDDDRFYNLILSKTGLDKNDVNRQVINEVMEFYLEHKKTNTIVEQPYLYDQERNRIILFNNQNKYFEISTTEVTFHMNGDNNIFFKYQQGLRSTDLEHVMNQKAEAFKDIIYSYIGIKDSTGSIGNGHNIFETFLANMLTGRTNNVLMINGQEVAFLLLENIIRIIITGKVFDNSNIPGLVIKKVTNQIELESIISNHKSDQSLILLASMDHELKCNGTNSISTSTTELLDNTMNRKWLYTRVLHNRNRLIVKLVGRMQKLLKGSDLVKDTTVIEIDKILDQDEKRGQISSLQNPRQFPIRRPLVDILLLWLKESKGNQVRYLLNSELYAELLEVKKRTGVAFYFPKTGAAWGKFLRDHRTELELYFKMDYKECNGRQRKWRYRLIKD